MKFRCSLKGHELETIAETAEEEPEMVSAVHVGGHTKSFAAGAHVGRLCQAVFGAREDWHRCDASWIDELDEYI